MADIAAAGGSLLVPYWREDGQPDLRQRAAAAIRFGKVPDGQRLVMTHVSGGSWSSDWKPTPPVWSLLRSQYRPDSPKPHPVAGRYRDRTDDHLVSRAAVSRSVRTVHALSVEAERRGYEVSNSESRDNAEQTRRSREAVTHLVIAIRGHRYQLSVTEEKVLLRGDWEERRRANEAYRNQRTPTSGLNESSPTTRRQAGSSRSTSLPQGRYGRAARPPGVIASRGRSRTNSQSCCANWSCARSKTTSAKPKSDASRRSADGAGNRSWRPPASDTARPTVPTCYASRLQPGGSSAPVGLPRRPERDPQWERRVVRVDRVDRQLRRTAGSANFPAGDARRIRADAEELKVCSHRA